MERLQTPLTFLLELVAITLLVLAAAGPIVELLIAECSVPDHAPVENHLSPTGVAELAADAQPRTLVLTHIYPQVEREGLVELIRSLGFRGAVELSEDGLVIEM